MEENVRKRIQLNCLYEMFRDRVEENVIYIVYVENEGKIDTTIDQLMSISSCSFTGHHFDQPKTLAAHNSNNVLAGAQKQPVTTSSKIPTNDATRRDSPVNVSSSRLTASTITQIASEPQSKPGHGSAKKVDKGVAFDLKDTTAGGDGTEHDESGLDLAERIDRLQRSIDDLLLEKRSSNDKASQYLTRKMYPVTSYYSELASQFHRMIEAKTNKLVDLLLERSENSNYIDLHGLNPIQAKLVVSELLRIREHKLMIDKQGEASIDIITGWGRHSVTQGQRIRPTIVALLREKGLEYHHLNKGALRVTIRRC